MLLVVVVFVVIVVVVIVVIFVAIDDYDINNVSLLQINFVTGMISRGQMGTFERVLAVGMCS